MSVTSRLGTETYLSSAAVIDMDKPPVHVKCYYAPVSVESRLLEWRKRASKKDATDAVMASVDFNQEAKIVCASMDGDDEDHQSVVTAESSDEDSGDDDDYKAAAVDKRNDSDREIEGEPTMGVHVARGRKCRVLRQWVPVVRRAHRRVSPRPVAP
jgi:Tfp pilus assembly major pilin PilA